MVVTVVVVLTIAFLVGLVLYYRRKIGFARVVTTYTEDGEIDSTSVSFENKSYDNTLSIKADSVVAGSDKAQSESDSQPLVEASDDPDLDV